MKGSSLRLSRLFLVLRVGLAFAIFGAGAVVLALALLPLSRLAALFGASPDLFAQRQIARSFALFVFVGRVLGLWKLDARGIERLAVPGTLIVANHPTLMDVVFLLSRIPHSDCVVKDAAWQNPALAGIVRAAHYIRNDQGEEAIDACVARLEAGRTLLLFPEGSRSPAVGLGTFKRGAAHVALRSGRPLVPVFIDCNPPALKKDVPWWIYPEGGIRISIEVGEPIDSTEHLEDGRVTPRSARHLNEVMRRVFDLRFGLR